jgi:hypothetical protein
MGAVIAAVAGSLVGSLATGFVVYKLSGRRARKEWLHQKRVEVLAELYRLLSMVQATARMATIPGVPLGVRRRRIEQNKRALHKLSFYVHGHALWMDTDSLKSVPATIKKFVEGLSSALKPYEAELHKGTPDSALALAAAAHVQKIVPDAEKVLEEQFREIVRSKRWREYLADGLEWFQTRGRN